MPRVSLPAPVRRLLGDLRRVWRRHHADGYIVGGCLRDLLLDRPVRDIDVALAGDPTLLAQVAAEATGGRAFGLDEERGIMRVVLPEGAAVSYVDITLLRVDIESDLAQRDFTIDAMALPLAAVSRRAPQPLIDPYAGAGDLRGGLVRAVGDGVFRADGLRLLRAVRLCAELGFFLDDATAALIRRDAAYLDPVAPERKRDELVRILATRESGGSLRQLDGLGLLERVLPEVTACRGVTQPKEHYWDVFDHLIETVVALDFMLSEEAPAGSREHAFWRELWEQLAWLPGSREHFREELVEGRSRAALLKLAGLLHDIAKPETKAPDRTGRIRFLGHVDLGAEKAASIMQRLRFSNVETRLVATIVESHLRPGQMSNEGPPTQRAVYRFFRDTADAALDILFLTLADHLAARGPRLHLQTWRKHVAFVSYILGRYHLELPPAPPVRLVTGEDVMSELEIAPGPLVGRLLAAIEEARALGEISTREEALDLARRLFLAEASSPKAASR
ncbi:MAG: HD domain-containing protein [Dehalococcoidia bacterium]|jgi:poly(A) polymerase